ncbi:MAG: hypothetical protein ABJ308_13145 [Halieaceae bacterium]
MSRITRLLLLGSTLLLPAQLLAEAGWTEPAQITALEANLHGRILVELDVSDNPSGCKEKSMFYREPLGAGTGNMYRLLLEAASNRQRVKIRVSGSCHLKGYAEISAVTMVP